MMEHLACQLFYLVIAGMQLTDHVTWKQMHYWLEK